MLAKSTQYFAYNTVSVCQTAITDLHRFCIDTSLKPCITVGDGTSRNSHHKQTSVSEYRHRHARAFRLKGYGSTKDSCPRSTFQLQAKTMEIKEQVDVARTSQTSTDKKASPKDTLETYKAKYPDQAEDLETMLGRLQALKNFVDKNLNDLEDYAKLAKTTKGLFDTSVHSFESVLTQKEKQFTTLIDFTINVGGVEQLKRFVQHCFEKFSHLIKEESDDEEETDDYKNTCYDCLSYTLAAIQNFSEHVLKLTAIF